MEAYVSRVGLIDEALDQLLVRAKAAQADGIHMPGFTYEQSLGEIKRVTTGAPFAAGKDCGAVRRRQDQDQGAAGRRQDHGRRGQGVRDAGLGRDERSR